MVPWLHGLLFEFAQHNARPCRVGRLFNAPGASVGQKLRGVNNFGGRTLIGGFPFAGHRTGLGLDVES